MGILTKTTTLYPIRAAARMTRLSIDTLRAWEKRYDAVAPLRRNGIRMYRESDIERLNLLRQALERGLSISQAASQSDKNLQALASETAQPAAKQKDAPIEAILDAIDRFDYAAADRALTRLATLLPPRDLVHDAALPLMRIAGERWHEQRMRIAQEHMLSQLLNNLLGSVLRLYAPRNPPATILMATLSGDLHAFGLMASALLAAGSGLGVVHLGASVPSTEIIFAAKRANARVVLASITGPQDELQCREQLRRLRGALPQGVEIWAGVNPGNIDIPVKGILKLADFMALEVQLQRMGGRF